MLFSVGLLKFVAPFANASKRKQRALSGGNFNIYTHNTHRDSSTQSTHFSGTLDTQWKRLFMLMFKSWNWKCSRTFCRKRKSYLFTIWCCHFHSCGSRLLFQLFVIECHSFCLDVDVDTRWNGGTVKALASIFSLSWSTLIIKFETLVIHYLCLLHTATTKVETSFARIISCGLISVSKLTRELCFLTDNCRRYIYLYS